MAFEEFWSSSGAAGGGGDPGDSIGNSLRFRNGQELRRSSTPAIGETWTISYWTKLGTPLGTDQSDFYWFNFGQQAGVVNLYTDNWSTNPSQNWRIKNAQGSFYFDGFYRDFSAWYHIVWRNNGGTSTMWVNGVQKLTTTATMNITAGQFVIGRNNDNYGSTTSSNFEGYQAQWYFIDGQALEPLNNFGRFNENGVWVPVDYDGTYGDEGFHLDFSDPSDLGNDSSGNNNDFTPTGFETTSTNILYDVMDDSPTQNFAVVNTSFVSSQRTEVANMQSRATGSSWSSPFVPQGMTLLRIDPDQDVYFELSTGYGIDNNYNSWATGFIVSNEQLDDGNFDNDDIWNGGCGFTVEIATNNWNNNQNLGVNAQNDITTDGSTWSGNQIMGVRINNNEITITRNGAATNVTDEAFDATAADGDGFYYLYAYNYYGSSDSNAWTHWNFGQRPFSNRPAGLNDDTELQTQNIPDATILDGRDHFRAITATGANILTSAQNAFSAGLWWIKDRDNDSTQHQFVDSVRGTTARTTCPALAVEGNYSAPSGNSVAWCWNWNQSSPSTNGFDIVTWTGNGNANRTINTNLTEDVEFIIPFCRSRQNNYAPTWHVSLGTNAANAINENEATANLSSWTSGWVVGSGSNILVGPGDSNQSNATDETYIAYCWHSVPGYSAFGSFTGNSSTDGPFIYLGFRPAFFMWKKSSGTGNWEIRDTTRTTTNPDEVTLYANQQWKEAGPDSNQSIDILSNGVKIRNGQSNMNQGTLIYIAFAENPFGGANAVPATAR